MIILVAAHYSLWDYFSIKNVKPPIDPVHFGLTKKSNDSLLISFSQHCAHIEHCFRVFLWLLNWSQLSQSQSDKIKLKLRLRQALHHTIPYKLPWFIIERLSMSLPPSGLTPREFLRPAFYVLLFPLQSMGQGGALGSGVYPSSPLRTWLRREAAGQDGSGSEPVIGLQIPLET